MIYWDANAGAPLLPSVRERLCATLSDAWGNPGAVHAIGRRARARLDLARSQVAELLKASSPREIVFTGSGSEAAALAVIGTWLARGATPRRKVVSTLVEHPSVLGALQRLEELGAEVVLLPPTSAGAVDLAAVTSALDEDVFLCSVMWANNETGVVQPVEAIAAHCRERGIVFHTDAVQAAGKLAVRVDTAPIDLLSLSAHKLGGPPGVGVLYDRREIQVAALIPGHQENGRRGGTPSLALAEAAALALAHAEAHREEYAQRVEPLRDLFEAETTRRLGAQVNGAPAQRLPNTSNLRFPGIDGEALLIALDLEGIAVSTGAACASGSLSPSHVLVAMGLGPADAAASVRFSLGPDTTRDEVSAVVAALGRHLEACRTGSRN